MKTSKLTDALTELKQGYLRLRCPNSLSIDELEKEARSLEGRLDSYESQATELKSWQREVLSVSQHTMPWSVDFDLRLQTLLFDNRQLVSCRIHFTCIHTFMINPLFTVFCHSVNYVDVVLECKLYATFKLCRCTVSDLNWCSDTTWLWLYQALLYIYWYYILMQWFHSLIHWIGRSLSSQRMMLCSLSVQISICKAYFLALANVCPMLSDFIWGRSQFLPTESKTWLWTESQIWF